MSTGCTRDMTHYEFRPISLKEANAFVARYHRHNKPTVSHKFSIGLHSRGTLIGVGIAGRPVARHLDDGRTLEINRVCVKEGFPNACSKLYARLKKIGQLFGYTSIKTYTLDTESGSSLRALRAIPDKRVPPGDWNRVGRPSAHQPVNDESKIRWELLPYENPIPKRPLQPSIRVSTERCRSVWTNSHSLVPHSRPKNENSYEPLTLT